jgi:hypothetical protein
MNESIGTRDELWLQELLDQTWDGYFADVEQQNDVRITFGRRAKRRLGSISLDKNNPAVTIITMNGLFRMPEIPDYVIQATLVHELTHYAHGFNSPLEQRQQHPHAGGVMRREFAERGLLDLYLRQKRWIKENWTTIINRELPAARPRKATARLPRVPHPFWMRGA